MLGAGKRRLIRCSASDQKEDHKEEHDSRQIPGACNAFTLIGTMETRRAPCNLVERRHAGRHACRQAGRQQAAAGRQEGSQAGRPASRQASRQAGKHIRQFLLVPSKDAGL